MRCGRRAKACRPIFLSLRIAGCGKKRVRGRKFKMKTRALAMLLVSLSCVPGWAQERREDRRKFLDPKTQVSDDPRRIVVKPGPRGPEGTIVLRGGRIFDGTGAPAREGTLVIERNKIAKILPVSATGWPKDAQVIDVSGKTILPGLIDLHTHLTYPL